MYEPPVAEVVKTSMVSRSLGSPLRRVIVTGAELGAVKVMVVGWPARAPVDGNSLIAKAPVEGPVGVSEAVGGVAVRPPVAAEDCAKTDEARARPERTVVKKRMFGVVKRWEDRRESITKNLRG